MCPRKVGVEALEYPAAFAAFISRSEGNFRELSRAMAASTRDVHLARF